MPVNIIAVEVAMISPLTIVGMSAVWTETLVSQAKTRTIAPTTIRTALNFRNVPAFFCFAINAVCFKSIIYFALLTCRRHLSNAVFHVRVDHWSP
jgi:hypothetical protein